jgi:deazaflavin-dependent oxidoreductase (nitroreductase family)
MALPPAPDAGSLRAKAWNQITRANVWVYRLSGGRLLGRFGQAPVLLLHHVGRRSGQARTTPLLYLLDEPSWVIVASAGGRSQHPAWVHNLRASPETEIEVGAERVPVRAREATETERERLWPRLTEIWPEFDVYETRAPRTIPVIVLERR